MLGGGVIDWDSDPLLISADPCLDGVGVGCCWSEMLSGGACSTLPGPTEAGPSACWLGQSGRVVGPAGPLIGVRSGGRSGTPQRGQLLPSPGWAGVPGRCQVAGMGQLPRNVPVGRFRNGALRSLYPHARGFGTWRERWGFHFREFPVLAVGGPRTAHLSRYPMLWGEIQPSAPRMPYA